MTSKEQAARTIFGQRAEWYTSSATHTEASVLSQVVEQAGALPHHVALDIGTGTGHTALALAPHISSVIGLDLTPEMLRQAALLMTRRSVTNLHLCIGNAHSLPFPDSAFDIVTCRRTAHHFSNIELALREMHRVLRTGASLVIDDRSVPEESFIDALMNKLDWYHDESHVREYTPAEWVAMLAGADFEVHSVTPYVRHHPLTSLTAGVSPENVRQIHRTLETLDAQQKAALNLVEQEGELYLNHWYVMLSATSIAVD